MNFKSVIILNLVVLFFIIISKSIAIDADVSCTVGEPQIVQDWGFYNIGNGLPSAWKFNVEVLPLQNNLAKSTVTTTTTTKNRTSFSNIFYSNNHNKDIPTYSKYSKIYHSNNKDQYNYNLLSHFTSNRRFGDNNKNNNQNNNNNNNNNIQRNILNTSKFQQKIKQQTEDIITISKNEKEKIINSNNNQEVIFCTDDQCGSSRFILNGYFYALFPLVNKPNTLVNYNLYQNVTIYPMDNLDRDTLYLDFFISTTALFPPHVQTEITISLGGNEIDTFVTIPTFGESYSIDLGPFLANGYNTTYLLDFFITYGVNHTVDDSSDRQFAFQLSNIQIRRGIRLGPSFMTPNKYTPSLKSINSSNNNSLYVDIVNGSDRYGNGSIGNPFNTLQMAISYMTSGDTLFIQPGVYCGQSMLIQSKSNLNLVAVNPDPTVTIINGQSLLPVFHFSFDGSSSQRGNGDVDDGGNDSSVRTININGLTVTNSYSTKYSSGGGAMFIEGSVNVTCTNCIFTNNIDHYDRGAILLRGNSNLALINTTVRNCSSSLAANYGPAISIVGFQSYQSLVIHNCLILGNQHALYVDQNNQLEITNTIFNGTGAITNLPCSVLITRSPFSRIHNATFSNSGNGALCIVQSAVNIDKSIFIGNSLKDRAGANLYISQSSNVVISNGIISQSIGSSGAALFVMEQSIVTLVNTAIAEIVTGESGAIIASSESDLIFNNVVIQESVSDYLFYLFYGSVTLDNSIVQAVVGGVWATQTNLIFKQSKFEKIRSGINRTDTYLVQQSTIQINDCIFNDHGDIYLANSMIEMYNTVVSGCRTFIQIPQNSSANIYNSTFYDNSDSVFVQQASSYLSVVNSTFYNNQAAQGSILYQHPRSLTQFSDTMIFNNSATQNGGCFYVGRFSILTLVEVVAMENKASMGGVIASEVNTRVDVIGGLYANNSADGGGGVIYFNEQLNISESNYPIFSGNIASYGPDFASPPSNLILDSSTPFPSYVVSNVTMFSGTVYVVDLNEQVVKTSNQYVSLKIYLNVDMITIDISQVVNGSAQFENVVIYGTVGQLVPVHFMSNDPNLNALSIVNGTTIAECTAGSVPSGSGSQCQVCQTGSYGYNGKTCVQCPTQCYCQGGEIIQTKPGFWYDVNEYPRVVYNCPNRENCVGNNTCAPHTYGPLCASCNETESYYQWGGKCVHCQNSSPYIFLAPFAGALLIFWVQRSDSESGLMTIIIYFAQTLMVLSQGVNFSFFAIFNLQLDSGQTGVFGDFCPGPFSFYERHYITLLAIPFLLLMLLMSTIVIVIFHRTRWCNTQNGPVPRTDIKSSFASRQINALIKLLITLYSPIAQSALQMFFCTQIGIISVLIANNSVTCDGGDYRKALAISYGLFVFILGLPLVMLVLLFKNRRSLDDDYVIRVYGVFFLKYKDDFYFWDVLMLVRRLFIVTIALMPQASNLRMFLLTCVGLLFVILQVKFQPFKFLGDNHLELASLLLLFFCCVYLDNNVWFNTEQWIVLGCGLIFIIILVYIVYNHYKQDILDYTNHALYFFTCGNHGQKRINKYEYLDDDEKFSLGGKNSLSSSRLFDRPRSTSRSSNIIVSQYGSIAYEDEGDDNVDNQVNDNQKDMGSSTDSYEDVNYNNEIKLMTAEELASDPTSNGHAILSSTPGGIPSVYQD